MNSGSIRTFLFVLALIAAGAVAYFSFDWAVGAAIHNRKVVMVPDLSGKQVNEALNLLGPLRLGLTKEGEQFDKRFPAGSIVRQTPPPGMMVREGRIVRIAISQGGETLFVPDLVGQPMRNAQTALQNVGLGIGEIDRKPSLRFEKDHIMTTDPPAGSIVAKNALVDVVVSAGPPSGNTLLVPDFVGKSFSEVKRWADTHRVTVSTREEDDVSRAAGEVIMQAPTADSPVREGETLTVVVNRGTGSEGGEGSGPRVRFDVPAGSSDRDVRITVVDEAGEREVFRKAQAPGSRVEIPIQAQGHARVRIFVNGINVQEQEINP